MLRYAARAVPWPRVLLSSCLVLALMEVVRRWPFPTWSLQAAAVGLVAGAAAWALDEPAARVVDTSPRGLGWRTAARLPALVVLGATWALVVARLDTHRSELLVQGLAALLLAAGWTSLLRSRGHATPGWRFGALAIPVALAWGLAGGYLDEVPVFPGPASSAADWSTSTVAWSTVGGLAIVVLVAALADAPWWRLRRLT